MIYLDHNSTTPVLSEVLEVMLPWLSSEWGNPSSFHTLGLRAHNVVEKSRDTIANLLSAEAQQLVFTGSATESINSAINSAILRYPNKKHIVTSAVEHSATLAYCEHLERDFGFEITRLAVNQHGLLDLVELSEAIREDTALVSLIWANNETGVIWPVEHFASLCRDRGVLCHFDGVQAVGKIPVNFKSCGADYLSFSGHKIGCPKGVGALLIEQPKYFKPLIYGGNQEYGLRGGTENVSFIVALAKATELSTSPEVMHTWDNIRDIRDGFEAQIIGEIPNATVNGKEALRLPNTLSLFLPGIDNEAAVTFLNQRGICVSSGSACMESAITPSHVIYAMSGSHERASETIRISLGRYSTKQELDRLGTELLNLIQSYGT